MLKLNRVIQARFKVVEKVDVENYGNFENRVVNVKHSSAYSGHLLVPSGSPFEVR